MRYFLISFTLKDKWSIGKLTLEKQNFPSEKYINETIKNINSDVVEDVIIINIFEFKNYTDYNSFLGFDEKDKEDEKFENWKTQLIFFIQNKFLIPIDSINKLIEEKKNSYENMYAIGFDIKEAVEAILGVKIE